MRHLGHPSRHAQPTMTEALEQLGQVGLSLEVQIYHALDHLFRQLAATKYPRVDGVEKRINLIGVDANNWGKIVKQACLESPLTQMLLPLHGEYFGPNETPISSYRQQPGEVLGEEWIIKAKNGVQYARFDANYWKTATGRRIATPHPSPGSLTIYGPEGTRHSLLGRHLDSEIREPAWGKRQIDEWKIRPGETENHWWDDLVGCAALASIRGCKMTTNVSNSVITDSQLQISFGEWPSTR